MNALTLLVAVATPVVLLTIVIVDLSRKIKGLKRRVSEYETNIKSELDKYEVISSQKDALKQSIA